MARVTTQLVICINLSAGIEGVEQRKRDGRRVIKDSVDGIG